MASEMKLFEMNKKDMQNMTEAGGISLLLTILISCLCTVILHVYSERQAVITQPPVPIVFIILEIVFKTIILLITITAIRFLFTTPQSFDHDRNHFNEAMSLLLIAAVSFSLPFRGLAEIVRERNGVQSRVFLVCNDIATAMGSGLLYLFFWTYPTLWTTVPEQAVSPFKAFVCAMYTALRCAVSFAFRIHFEDLPLQHLFSFVKLVSNHEDAEIEPAALGSILSISTVECVLFCCVFWNYSSCAAVLSSANDPSKQHGVIALWYYRKAFIFLCSSTVASTIARVTSPILQASVVLQQTSVTLLSGSIGNAAISLAVLSFAIRQLYVHSSSEDGEVPFIFVLFIGSRSGYSRKKEAKIGDNDLLYRIADERDPQNEDPIPQPNTFYFESAMLLFNSAWLATTYATRGVKPLTPSEFGRPMCAVRSVIGNASNTVVVVILERMDRLILAFKPVLRSVERQDHLRPLPSTELGNSLSKSLSEDHELLPVKDTEVSIGGLLKHSKLHSGYTQAYSSIQAELHTSVQNLTMDTSRPIYVTGFGSGGALATLCAFDLSLRNISETNPVSVYTYGSPQVLNMDMANLFEAIVPYRWRCVVAGDCRNVQPSGSMYRHFSKVATFTRSGHLALEFDRIYKWWQSEVSAHPMHKISAYYCAFAKWHKAYHVKGPIDLWDWQIDKTVSALFNHDPTPPDLMSTVDFMLESPTIDVEAKSLRRVKDSMNWSSSPEDVVAFKR